MRKILTIIFTIVTVFTISACQRKCDMPEYLIKGALINIKTNGITEADKLTDDTYRVLSVEGNKVKVLKMTPYDIGKYNDSSVTSDFNGTEGQRYDGSLLDKVMDDFYDSLDPTISKAIIPQNIKQGIYEFQKNNFDELRPIMDDAIIQYDFIYLSSHDEDDKNGIFKISEIDVGKRYVYAPDFADIVEYFGEEYDAKLLNSLFFNIDSSTEECVWMRSAYSSRPNYACYIDGVYGEFSARNYHFRFEYRPCFVIDLSKLG